jgi:Domain of unknown function (DUF4407)
MGRVFIWLSGAQPDILARHRPDHAKYVGIGFAVLVTATMAAVSLTFALHSALKASLVTALPFAIAWGIAIMGLDRWLVASFVRQPNKWMYLILAVPRVLLALLFGAIISTPFVLQIFQPEINQQIALDQRQQAANFYAQLATDSLAKRIAVEQKQVGNYENVINDGGSGSGVNVSQDPTVRQLSLQYAQAKAQAAIDYNKWHCELYGTPGHCSVGNGPAAQASLAAYQTDVREENQYQAELTAREQQIGASNKSAAAASVANAKQGLGPAEARLAADQAEQARLKQSFNATNASTAGLLLRLHALDQVAGRDGTMQLARLLLFLFFTVIDCLPILVKTLLNLGPETAYERALAVAEQTSVRLSEHETMRAFRDELAAGDEESELMLQAWQQRKLPGLVDDATDARERVARTRLGRWEQNAPTGPGSGIDGDAWYGPGTYSSIGRAPTTSWTRRPRTRTAAVMSHLRQAWRAFRRPNEPQWLETQPIDPGQRRAERNGSRSGTL